MRSKFTAVLISTITALLLLACSGSALATVGETTTIAEETTTVSAETAVTIETTEETDMPKTDKNVLIIYYSYTLIPELQIILSRKPPFKIIKVCSK